MGRTTARGKRILALTAVCIAFAGSGCSQRSDEPAIRPSEAKSSIVDVVEKSSTVVGGEWERYSGPSVQDCRQNGGAAGAAYVYIVEQKDSTAPGAKVDIDATSALWVGLGIEVEQYQSSGDDPILGVRGTGGPVLSIAFDAYPGQYTIAGVSKCSDGMPDKLRLEK